MAHPNLRQINDVADALVHQRSVFLLRRAVKNRLRARTVEEKYRHENNGWAHRPGQSPGLFSGLQNHRSLRGQHHGRAHAQLRPVPVARLGRRLFGPGDWPARRRPQPRDGGQPGLGETRSRRRRRRECHLPERRRRTGRQLRLDRRAAIGDGATWPILHGRRGFQRQPGSGVSQWLHRCPRTGDRPRSKDG